MVSPRRRVRQHVAKLMRELIDELAPETITRGEPDDECAAGIGAAESARPTIERSTRNANVLPDPSPGPNDRTTDEQTV
jgi:hypothetical protein